MILQHNASVNMYMFIGGTDFGFLAGANTIDVFPHYAPDVSSYGKLALYHVLCLFMAPTSSSWQERTLLTFTLIMRRMYRLMLR